MQAEKTHAKAQRRKRKIFLAALRLCDQLNDILFFTVSAKFLTDSVK